MMSKQGKQDSQDSQGSEDSEGSDGSTLFSFNEILTQNPTYKLISKVSLHKSALQDKKGALYMSLFPRQKDILGCKIEALNRLVLILNRAYRAPGEISSKEVADLYKVKCTVKGEEGKMKKAISYRMSSGWFWCDESKSKTQSFMEEACDVLKKERVADPGQIPKA